MNQFSIFEKQTIKNLFKKHNIRPLKKLGQNFLINKTVLKKIIDVADLSKKDIVLEIGPGMGILTLELAKRAKRVIAVEKDRKMCEILKEILGDSKNVEIINADILGVRPLKILRGRTPTKYKIVANLPHYITSPIIRKFLEMNPSAGGPPIEMTLLIQKEVAQRICAKPGKMSILAVSVQFYALPKIISYVSRKSFWPVPKVDSAIIKIIPRKSALLSAPAPSNDLGPAPSNDLGLAPSNDPGPFRDKFFELVKTGFSSKRKMLKNNLLKKLKVNLPAGKAGSQKLKVIFKQLNINPKTRAENLSIDDWIKLYEKICEK